MNRVFYLFRHGETNWNQERRCQGHTNINLNLKGIEQALGLAHKMMDIPIEIIYSSDLSRAVATGEFVAQRKGIPLHIDPRLREMHYGEAEGLLFSEAIKIFGEERWQQLQDFHPDNDGIGFPGGESRKEARERFHACLKTIIENTNYQTVGISTHGGAIRTILHSFLPLEQKLLPIPNCVVYRCDYIFAENRFIVDPNPI